MRTITLRRVCVPLLLLGLLAGCQGKQVVVADKSAFEAMARRTAPELQRRDILDSDGAYLISLLTSLNDVPQDSGQRLFQRLSPAFRYRGTDTSMLPASFAQAKALGDTLHMSPTEFILDQGEQRVAVSLIGLADWNNAEIQSWFVQCRILWPSYNEERIYYLVVENPEATVYHPQVLAIYDCRQGRCVTYRTENQAREMPVEDAIVDLLPGQQEITAPPKAQ